MAISQLCPHAFLSLALNGSLFAEGKTSGCVDHTEQRDSEGRWDLVAMLRILDFALPMLGSHR